MYDSRLAELKVVDLMQSFSLEFSIKTASDAFEVSQSDSGEDTMSGQPWCWCLMKRFPTKVWAA